MGETDFLVKLSITHLLYEVIVGHKDTFILLVTILILLRLAAYQNPKKLEVKRTFLNPKVERKKSSLMLIPKIMPKADNESEIRGPKRKSRQPGCWGSHIVSSDYL